MEHHVNTKTAIFIWLFLVLATFSTTTLYKQTQIDPRIAVNIIFALAYLKGRGIVLAFMSMNKAPMGWRVAYELWLIAVTALIALFWNINYS